MLQPSSGSRCRVGLWCVTTFVRKPVKGRVMVLQPLSGSRCRVGLWCVTAFVRKPVKGRVMVCYSLCQ